MWKSSDVVWCSTDDHPLPRNRGRRLVTGWPGAHRGWSFPKKLIPKMENTSYLSRYIFMIDLDDWSLWLISLFLAACFFSIWFFPKKHHSALSLAPSQPCWLVQGSLRTHGNSYRPGAVPAWPVDGTSFRELHGCTCHASATHLNQFGSSSQILLTTKRFDVDLCSNGDVPRRHADAGDHCCGPTSKT